MAISVAADTRTTDWIMTASGRRFWPIEPRIEDVSIKDIAHHLSHLCRFTGAVRTFYSVAQHSVLVSQLLAPPIDPATVSAGEARRHRQAGLFGLLHDASEAYLTDVPRPLKRSAAFGPYRDVEAQLQRVIYASFGLHVDDEPPDLKLVDRRMLRTEQRDLMPPPVPGEARDDVDPFLTVNLRGPYIWSPQVARMFFLERFVALVTGDVEGTV
jgi:hypothetical protein